MYCSFKRASSKCPTGLHSKFRTNALLIFLFIQFCLFFSSLYLSKFFQAHFWQVQAHMQTFQIAHWYPIPYIPSKRIFKVHTEYSDAQNSGCAFSLFKSVHIQAGHFKNHMQSFSVSSNKSHSHVMPVHTKN